MTDHSKDWVGDDYVTFQVKGMDAGFALHKVGHGQVDIINVHNNSGIRGLANAMLAFAKSQGGNMLDNYAGKLSDIYGQHGFDVYDRYEWDDQYRPDNWDDDNGTPDVEMRRHPDHYKKYNMGGGYKNHFDKKMEKRFPPKMYESIMREVGRWVW